MAAARNVSAAPKTTLLPAFLNWYASFPIVVVFPTPFTPTTIITYGFLSDGTEKSGVSALLFSASISVISSRSSVFSSDVDTYLSRAVRFCSRSIILRVVSTPTSDVINTSSRLSRKSSSILDLPATARLSLSNKPCLVFSKPLSNVSFFSLLKKLKNPIYITFFIQIILAAALYVCCGLLYLLTCQLQFASKFKSHISGVMGCRYCGCVIDNILNSALFLL